MDGRKLANLVQITKLLSDDLDPVLKDKLTALINYQWSVSNIADFLFTVPGNGQLIKEAVRLGLKKQTGGVYLPRLKELSGSLLTDTQLLRRAIDLSAKGIPWDWFQDALRQDPKRYPYFLRQIFQKLAFEFETLSNMLSYIDTEKFAKYFPARPRFEAEASEFFSYSGLDCNH